MIKLAVVTTVGNTSNTYHRVHPVNVVVTFMFIPYKKLGSYITQA